MSQPGVRDLDRSDVERLVIIEAGIRQLQSTMVSLKNDLKVDGGLLHELRDRVTRMAFELDLEKQARAEQARAIGNLDKAMRDSMEELRQAVAENTVWRRQIMVGVGLISLLAGIGGWLLANFGVIQNLLKRLTGP